MAIQIRRREFIVTLGGAVATCPLVARAQQTVRVLRVGFVGGQPRDAAIYVAFQKRMAELGYRDRYFTFEYIQTPSIDAYDASFRELGARKPDIVMAAGNEPALRAVRAAAGTLPIVFLAVDFDPVEKRLCGEPGPTRRQHHGNLRPSARIGGETHRVGTRVPPASAPPWAHPGRHVPRSG